MPQQIPPSTTHVFPSLQFVHPSPQQLCLHSLLSTICNFTMHPKKAQNEARSVYIIVCSKETQTLESFSFFQFEIRHNVSMKLQRKSPQQEIKGNMMTIACSHNLMRVSLTKCQTITTTSITSSSDEIP
jgi:hypothetical protein